MLQVSDKLIYATNDLGEIVPIKKNRIRRAMVHMTNSGIWIIADIDGWYTEKWVWRPEDGARDFHEYLECLVSRKEYVYMSEDKKFITFIRGRDIVSVNVSGGYVKYSDGCRVNGSLPWLCWMRNVRKKWKKHRGRASREENV